MPKIIPIRWLLTCVRPYSRQMAVLGALSLTEIGLRVLAPWPLKTIVDRLIPSAANVASNTTVSTGGAIMRIAAAGLLLQLAHQAVMLCHTRLQTRIGQRIVFDTQSRLFSQLQYVSLTHHDSVSTSDAVYRVNTDAAALEHLMLRSLFPT